MKEMERPVGKMTQQNVCVCVCSLGGKETRVFVRVRAQEQLEFGSFHPEHTQRQKQFVLR